MVKEKDNKKLISQNKKAYHEYYIEETYQSGIELVGTEVKSLRNGRCNLKDSFVKIIHDEAYIINLHISPYEQGNIFNKDPLRIRKLLLNKKEIFKLKQGVSIDGYSIIPLKLYFVRNFVKVDIGLAKGKKLYDKRNDIAKKDQLREAEKDFKSKYRIKM